MAPGMSAAGRNIAISATLLHSIAGTASLSSLVLPGDVYTTAKVFVMGVSFSVFMLLILSQPKLWLLSLSGLIGPGVALKISSKYPAIDILASEYRIFILLSYAVAIMGLLWVIASIAYGRSIRFKRVAGSKHALGMIKNTGLSDPAIWRLPQMWGSWISVSTLYAWLLARAFKRTSGKPDAALKELLPFSLAPAAHWVSYAWTNLLLAAGISVFFGLFVPYFSRCDLNAAFLVIFAYAAFASSLSMLPVAISATRAEQRLLSLMPNTVGLRNGNTALFNLIRTILLRSFPMGVATFALFAWVLRVSLDKSLLALLIIVAITCVVIGRNARDYAFRSEAIGYGWLVLEPILYAILLLLLLHVTQGNPVAQWAIAFSVATLAAAWMVWRLRALASYASAFPVGRLAD